MTGSQFAKLQGWDIAGWSLPRNGIFKISFANFGRPKNDDPEFRRGEAYFIEPKELKIQIESGSRKRIIVTNTLERLLDPGNVAVDIEIFRKPSVKIICRQAKLIWLP